MAYQMTVNLTEQEYAALSAEAAKSGKQPEALLHEIMTQRFQTSVSTSHALTGREFMEKLYREGDLLNLPGNEPLTQEEQNELERLATLFAGGKSASEIVIEDRGPY